MMRFYPGFRALRSWLPLVVAGCGAIVGGRPGMAAVLSQRGDEPELGGVREHDHDNDHDHDHDHEHEHEHGDGDGEGSSKRGLGRWQRLPGAQPFSGFAFPDISAALIGGLNYFSDVPTERFPAHEPTGNRGGFRFELQELEIGLQSQLLDQLRMDIFLGVTPTGLWMEEAFMMAHDLPGGVEVKAGLFLHKFGYFNPKHFLSLQPFVDMPLVLRRFIGGEQLRGIGIDVAWRAPLPWSLELTGAFTTANNPLSYGVSPADSRKLADFLALGRLRQVFPLAKSWQLLWAVSAAQGPNISGGIEALRENRTVLAGTNLGLMWRHPSRPRAWELHTEYLMRNSGVPGAEFLEGGVYVQTEARLSAYWSAALRFDYVGLPARVEGTPILPESMAPWYTADRQWRAGTSVSLWFTDLNRVRVQYNFDRLLPSSGAMAKNVHELFLQFHVVMGKHSHVGADNQHDHFHENGGHDGHEH